MVTTESFRKIGNLKFKFTSDVFKGEELDTIVEIISNNINIHVCWIEAKNIEVFGNDLESLINKYRI